MRKKDQELRDRLLKLATEIAFEQGPQALSIRTLAQRAGVASGTVYNYFENKSDILVAVTEEYWHEAMLELRRKTGKANFYDELPLIYSFLAERLNDPARNWMHSLAGLGGSSRDRMAAMQNELEKILIAILQEDETVSGDTWNDKCSEKDFCRFVVLNLFTYLQMKSTEIECFLEIVKISLYGKGELK